MFRRFASSRAVLYAKHGHPQDVLTLSSQEFATPLATQAVVRIQAAPINPADLNQVTGTYAVQPSLPAVGGNEGVGVVESVGGNVSGLKPGQRVLFGASGMGTWRTAGVFEADQLIPIDKDIPIESAATLGVNACTAFRLLSDFGGAEKGDVVLANGGSSAVAGALASLCAARGVKLVLTMRDRPDWDAMVERLKAQGAEAVVDESIVRTPAFKRLLSDWPAPKLALNCVGGRSATELARHLGDGGKLVTYGGMSRQPVTLPTSLHIFRNISSHGFWMTAWNKRASIKERQAMLDELVSLVKAGKLQTFVERHPFADFDKALERYHQGQLGRKIVLTMDK